VPVHLPGESRYGSENFLKPLNTPQPSTTELTAWLEFPTGERVPLQALCSIGRTPVSQVVIDNERVSRRHAVIRRAGDGTYELMDMGSSNGTYLNGRRIDRPAVLAHGQVIEVGLQKMTFRMPAAEARTAEAPTVVDGWLLVVEAALRGARTPIQHFSDKTVESWNERCHRTIVKQKGTPVRALKEGLLAYWRSDLGDQTSTLVTTTLRSLRALQKDTEEFRFAVHYGPMTFKEGDGPHSKPSGDAIIYALQLQRLVSAVDTLVLISEAACQRCSDILPMRRLTHQEMRDKGGADAFYTLRE
jgi:pSer/pThr/pTyr-binding forkhead associated (FHA) protein